MTGAARHTVRITVGLKVTDNEARSALEALQEKMGLRDRVSDLIREEVWEVALRAPTPDAARATVERLVRTTNLFANPNKHRYEIAAVGGAALAAEEVAVLVSDRESTVGDAVLSAIRRIGEHDVESVRKWTRWRVLLSAPPVEGDPEVLALIRRIGVATGRRDGLLSNPHSQVSRAVLPWGEEKVLAA